MAWGSEQREASHGCQLRLAITIMRVTVYWRLTCFSDWLVKNHRKLSRHHPEGFHRITHHLDAAGPVLTFSLILRRGS
jgi:hypothetical protein